MKEEIAQLSLQLKQLNEAFGRRECSQCLVMKHYVKLEYGRIKTRLQSLERLSASNSPSVGAQMIRARREAGMLGMYVMV